MWIGIAFIMGLAVGGWVMHRWWIYGMEQLMEGRLLVSLEELDNG